MIRSLIAGCGAYLPERVMTNAELARMVDTTDEWIVERTGIRERHIAADGQMTSDLAIAAAQKALDNAGVAAGDVDLIIVATATPDQTFPASACRVQGELGITRGAAFDLQAVCSGFIYALATADNFIRAGQSQAALVIGAETFSRILDWTDRGTCVLFGDGAGAVVLQAGEGKGNGADRGILKSQLRSDGRYRDLLYVDGGPSSTMTVGHLRMAGREVFRHAVEKLSSVVRDTLEGTNLTPADIDWLVPHQANLRIIDGTARKLNIDPRRVVKTIERHGNTSAASVPLALAEATGDGRIKKGQVVLMEAMGGGFTWGSVLARW
jgi:3-oxoacyl-[acyl-carrier-protein] synthase III